MPRRLARARPSLVARRLLLATGFRRRARRDPAQPRRGHRPGDERDRRRGPGRDPARARSRPATARSGSATSRTGPDEDRSAAASGAGTISLETGRRRESRSARRRLGRARPARPALPRRPPVRPGDRDDRRVRWHGLGSPNGSVAVGARLGLGRVRRLDVRADRPRRRVLAARRWRAPQPAGVAVRRARSGWRTRATRPFSASTRKRSSRARSGRSASAGGRPASPTARARSGSRTRATTPSRASTRARARRARSPSATGRPPSPAVRARSGSRTPADGTVSRIDPATNEVVATIEVGNAPAGIAVGDGFVWVAVQAP